MPLVPVVGEASVEPKVIKRRQRASWGSKIMSDAALRPVLERVDTMVGKDNTALVDGVLGVGNGETGNEAERR